jgi:hypothetical protein
MVVFLRCQYSENRKFTDKEIPILTVTQYPVYVWAGGKHKLFTFCTYRSVNRTNPTHIPMYFSIYRGAFGGGGLSRQSHVISAAPADVTFNRSTSSSLLCTTPSHARPAPCLPLLTCVRFVCSAISRAYTLINTACTHSPIISNHEDLRRSHPGRRWRRLRLLRRPIVPTLPRPEEHRQLRSLPRPTQ